MTIRLIHVHLLEALYLCYGVKCQSGVIWGHCVQKVIFTKNTLTGPCYIAWPYIVITYTYPLALHPLSHLWGQQTTWGQSGVDVSKPAGYAVCDGNVSSDTFILLVSVFFLATRLFRILPNVRFWPNLVKVTSTLTTTQAQTMIWSPITMGSLGSKRSFSPKRHQVLQNT